MNIDKNKFLLSLVIRKLSKDIDISKENIGIGKAYYKNLSVDDNEEQYFIELYCEISISILEEYAEYFNQDIKDFVVDLKNLIKDRIVWIVHKVFKNNKKLQEYNPNLKDLELDIGIENGYFIVQINITANAGGIQ